MQGHKTINRGNFKVQSKHIAVSQVHAEFEINTYARLARFRLSLKLGRHDLPPWFAAKPIVQNIMHHRHVVVVVPMIWNVVRDELMLGTDCLGDKLNLKEQIPRLLSNPGDAH